MTPPRKPFLARTAALAVLLLPALLPGCGSQETKSASADGPDARLTVPVEIAAVHQGTLSLERMYSASLEGQEQANIVPKISERVAGIHARVGMTVPANQLIITLDKAGASSQFYQAEAGFRNAEKSLERMKSLYTEGAVSLQSLDATQTAYDVARANFVAARSVVELTSPIAGVVTAVNTTIGDLAMPGVMLATVARIDRMKAIFSLNESDVTALAIGQKVTISSEARPDLTVQGSIIQISRSADVRSRSFEVKAMFNNTPDRWFRPGMFAKVRVQVSSGQNVLLVPSIAIQTDGMTSHVFVVKDGRAYQRSVETGMSDGERTEILKGILVTDSVATVGMNNVRDSSYVVVAHGAQSH
ncbi:MAG: efflux RND transporter periplasmic adaptor subunit [Bacteroidetes bacterium]|nr:efflux RND transporter periplasmic adaptor subunit [Bacteroidota bacterium]